MPDSKVQFTGHARATDDRPFLISSSLQFPPCHTKEQPQVGPSPSIMKDYHHQPQNLHRNSPLALQYHQSHAHPLEIFDPAFQVATAHGPGLLPMPVAYEDFHYALPNVEPPDRQVTSSVMRSTGLQQSNLGFIYQTYPSAAGSYGPNYHLPLLASDWDLNPLNRNQIASSGLPQDLLLPNFLNDSIQQESTHPSSALHPVPTPAPLEPISRSSRHLNSDRSPHNPPPPNLSDSTQMNYPLPNPPTPPPLLDATEQDLLSSFLNIFGDSQGECDFDPQGMPEGMPVLGELKRRLEEDVRSGSLQYAAKREADDMGRQVETGLKISDPESIYPHGRRPSLQSFHTTSGSLSSSSDSHLYQEQSFPIRKKAKSTHLINSFDAHPSHLTEPPPHNCVDLEGDTKMESWDFNASCEPGDWSGAVMSHTMEGSRSDHPYPSQLPKPFEPSFSQSAPLSPVSQPQRVDRVKDGSVTPFDAQISHSCSQKFSENQPSPANPRRDSKRGSKPPKSTHIVSEQRRRNAIQGGFGNLVEILRAGEANSGISIAVVESSNCQNNESNGGSATPTSTTISKPKTRGRGRRGEIETGASKSVVLEKAAEFVQWMSDGNLALKNEVERVENILKSYGVEV